jgi:hypothetical protein
MDRQDILRGIDSALNGAERHRIQDPDASVAFGLLAIARSLRALVDIELTRHELERHIEHADLCDDETVVEWVNEDFNDREAVRLQWHRAGHPHSLDEYQAELYSSGNEKGQ